MKRMMDRGDVYGGIAGVVLSLFLFVCASQRSTTRPEPDPQNCESACAKLKKLGCEEGADVDSGPGCVQFCEETQNSGHALNASCISGITSCSELERCGW